MPLLGDFTQPQQSNPLQDFFLRLNPRTPEAQAIIQQRMLNQEYQALRPQLGDNGALIGVMHPEILGQMAKPMDVQPGGSVYTPLNLFGGATGGAAPQGGGQAVTPGATPGAPGSPQAPAGGAMYTNTNGIPDEATLRRAAEQYVQGDATAVPATAGRSGLGALIQTAYQKMVTQVMGEQGLTSADVMNRQSRFPAVKAAVNKLYGAQASMGQAGLEFQQLFPQFMADLQKYGATQYPSANEFFQWLDRNKGNPDVAPLQQRMITLSNVYGRAVSQNPASANTDLKHREFGEALNQFWPLAATQRIGDAMSQEIQVAHDSVGKEANRLFVDNGLGRNLNPGNPEDAQTIANAKAALAKGVPQGAIKQKLSEEGYSTKGLF